MSINKAHFMLIIAVMFLWAICYPLIVIGLDYAPHLSFAALRASFAGLILGFYGVFHVSYGRYFNRHNSGEFAYWEY